ncbi:hypothetical protein [Tunicatimonas pelagia]|uniref:hypothetical protein n=1 Tax=Tunicatimonas pelagia TaxID=931531 RepID=UPI0026665DEA|nr:hypothetical protein [Tunicatimonas pelagia]WKN42893.1 hypothetical protein P0M28_28040 [Tunicatimonas pelagia]
MQLLIWLLLIATANAAFGQEPTFASTLPQNIEERKALSREYLKKANLYRQGSYIEQQLLDTALLIDSTNHDAWMAKASWAIKLGDYIGFDYLIGRAIVLSPESHLGYRAWLKLYTLRDYEGALQDFDHLDNLTPDFMDYPWAENIYYLRGLAHKQLKQYDLAIANFTECIKRVTAEMGADFVEPYCYVYRGIVYAQLDSSQAAMADFDAAIKLYPRCVEAYFHKAQILVARNQPNLACENFHQALSYAEQGYLRQNIYKEVFDELYGEDIQHRLQEYCVGDE